MPSPQKTLKVESLNSWKEISLYLDRGVRTVQRWERELGLPVHRIGRGPRSPVHAFPSELQAWLLRMGNNGSQLRQPGGRGMLHPDGTVAVSRVLVNRSSGLVRQMMQALWTQRQRAEELMETIESVRRSMRERTHDGKAGWPARQSSRPKRRDRNRVASNRAPRRAQNQERI